MWIIIRCSTFISEIVLNIIFVFIPAEELNEFYYNIINGAYAVT